MRQPLGYIPLTLTKSTNESGQVEYKMRGKMSTTSEDEDGQYLNPSGFDMTDFMGPEGFINWHHQQNKNPLAIIGKPTSYELDKEKNEMWVEFMLFEGNPMAQQVWKLQEVLQEQGLGLGLSLEGEATEVKDPYTGKIIKSKEAIENKIPLTYVERAKITGCAVTPAPKNKDSVVELVKGKLETEFDLIKGDIISEGSGSQIGESRHPLALESLNSEVTSLEYDSENGCFKTNQRILPKEYKTKEDAIVFLEKCYNPSSKLLSKSQVFAVLGKIFPLNTEKFERIYNFTVNLEKGNNLKEMETPVIETKVSPEKLEKALAELELLSKGEEQVVLGKGSEVEETPLDQNQRLEALEKGLDTLSNGLTLLINLQKEQLVKGKEEVAETKLEKATEEAPENKEEEKEDKDKEEEKLEKGTSSTKLTPDDDSPISLMKGFIQSQNETLNKFMTQTSELIKGQSETISTLKQTVDQISQETAGRKTVTTSRYLEKGNTKDIDEGLNVLSASTQKREILDMLTPKAVGESGILDESLSKAVMQFEQGNIITHTLQNALRKEGYTLIQ